MELDCRVTGLPVIGVGTGPAGPVLTGEFVLSHEHIIISNFLYNIVFSNRLC